MNFDSQSDRKQSVYKYIDGLEGDDEDDPRWQNRQQSKYVNHEALYNKNGQYDNYEDDDDDDYNKGGWGKANNRARRETNRSDF